MTAELIERSPKDFAIEFGEYLAQAAEFYIEATTMFRSDYDRNADGLRALKSAIYEFRKRADRAALRARQAGDET